MQSFLALNNAYNTMVSMMQVGLDMAPTPTQIATWKTDCSDYNRTLTAWQSMQPQLADFNTLLAKNNLQPLKLSTTALAPETCTFAPQPAGKPRK
jgi:hypothetical protein